jgi:hypothetical protein
MDAARAEHLIEQLAADNPLRMLVDALRIDNERLRAEKAERDAPVWLPLKLAAYRAELPYEKARAWAARAILAGCVNEARKDGGRVMVNVTALIAHRMHMPPPL